MLSDRQIAKRLKISYDTFLRWRKEKPLLYIHIKEGFTLKELVLGMDEHLKAILRQTQYIKLRNSILSEGDDTLYEVIHIEKDSQYDNFFSDKPYIWLKTNDLKALNVLTYNDALVSNEISEAEMLIDLNEYQAYGNEDETEWLVSNSLSIEHINQFFEWYNTKGVCHEN
jgi:hypothetical protein